MERYSIAAGGKAPSVCMHRIIEQQMILFYKRL